MKTSILLVVLSFAGVFCTERALYNNYQVHRVIPSSEEHLILLRGLEEIGFSFWSDVRGVGMPVDVMVAPHQRPSFAEFVEAANLEDIVYIEDVQQLIDNERPSVRSTRFDFSNYYELEEIYDYLAELESKYTNVKVVKGGTTYEGRDILGIHITNNNKNKTVFVEGGIHAREWIAPSTVLFITTQLLESTDPAIREVADSHDWYVFPVFNPDGYKYTFTTDRFWRKTRKPYGSCYGADPNRNWGYHWMDGGSDSYPCSETHAGSSAFSEPETKTMSEFITSVSDGLYAYLAFHSYSQYLLIPYGHSPAHVENYDQLERIGIKAANKLQERYGTEYTVGNIVEVIYVASGGSMDWVKGTYHTPITYTYELRDKGRFGFVLPADQIIPTGEETLDSFIVILQEAAKELS